MLHIMKKKNKWDFAGYVTRNDIQCSDGLVIKQDAFSGSTNRTVPLVWQHDYNSPSNVLGLIELENKKDGVYGYGVFNDTENAQDAKILVQHGDVNAMSIGAKGIRKDGNNVVSGEIYEVSLVLKGANPGAVIEHTIQHSAYGDFESEDQAIIHTGLEQTLMHGYDEEEEQLSYTEVLDTLTEEQAAVVAVALEEGVDSLNEEGLDILASLSDEQLEAVDALEEVMDELDDEESDDEDDNIIDINDYQNGIDNEDEDSIDEAIAQGMYLEGDDTLKHNAFANGNYYGGEEEYLTHSDLDVMVEAAAEGKSSSLAGVLQANGLDIDIKHGLTGIDILFPQPTEQKGIQVYNPQALNVDKIMSMFYKSPMSRIKNIFADISEEQARARGYIKGNEKFDSIEELFFRETTPGTILRRTKIDRDDIIDIQERGIDVVAFLQRVQQAKLQEEIVRAAFFGDGRPKMVGGQKNPDKISELHVRPIATDADLFTIKVTTQNWSTVVDSVIHAIPAYQGSGSPSLFINPFDLAKLKTLKDNNGRYLFASSMDSNQVPNNANIAAYFMCSEVIEYREMPIGNLIIGNLNDYAFGVGKGGQVASFNQFDIDFNQEKYLIETRVSGAIQTPKSFILVTVSEAGEANTDMLDFNPTGLRQHPTFTANSDSEEVPGKRYASAHGNDENTNKVSPKGSKPTNTESVTTKPVGQ